MCLTGYVKNLFAQLVKFGLIGVIAFVIDYGILNLLVHFGMNGVLAAAVSFTISLIFNYLASMKFVFVHRDDMARWMEMAIFLLSSLVGLGINEIIIWIATDVMLPADAITSNHVKYVLFLNIGKIIATIVVAIWNFVIRKWLLDAPDPNKPVNENSIAHKLGTWSLTHGPQEK